MPPTFDYKQEINNILATVVTDAGAKGKLRNGTMDIKADLFLDAGLTADDIAGQAQDFNALIVANGKKPPIRVATSKLRGCKTLEALYKLMEPSF